NSRRSIVDSYNCGWSQLGRELGTANETQWPAFRGIWVRRDGKVRRRRLRRFAAGDQPHARRHTGGLAEGRRRHGRGHRGRTERRSHGNHPAWRSGTYSWASPKSSASTILSPWSLGTAAGGEAATP